MHKELILTERQREGDLKLRRLVRCSEPHSPTKAIGGEQSVPHSSTGSLTSTIALTASNSGQALSLFSPCSGLQEFLVVECGGGLVVSVSSRKNVWPESVRKLKISEASCFPPVARPACSNAQAKSHKPLQFSATSTPMIPSMFYKVDGRRQTIRGMKRKWWG